MRLGEEEKQNNNKEHFAKRTSDAVSLIEIFVLIYRKKKKRERNQIEKKSPTGSWVFFLPLPLKDMMGLISSIMSELTDGEREKLCVFLLTENFGGKSSLLFLIAFFF